MGKAKKTAAVGSLCVACGCCEKVCPRGAVRVSMGVIAVVDREKCVGCGICAGVCPADVIEITERAAE